jgi:2-dehydro-3-deoxyphosphogluconate aldolase/(4S)-4-hydroxy-2-oxoglutarate aldolase
MNIFERIENIGIVPVIALSDVEKAVPLAKALLAGGIGCAEITFRTPEASASIKRIANEIPEMLVGAGTVLTCEQAELAKQSGAVFAVSPGFNPRVVKHCQDIGLPIIPGCATPSEMEAAMELGLDLIKFFPAEQAGGLDYIKAVAAPYTVLRFLPTGGISAANLVEYISFRKVIACGGSWMVKKEWLDAGNFDKITCVSREAAQIVKKTRDLNEK